MMKNKIKIQRLTMAAFFVVIELIMGFTPIGYIPVGALNITTMHLPVILAGILCGPSFGAGIGFVFGLTSLLRATFMPGITSFVFSPFVSVAGVSGGFASLLICFVPRILLGLVSGLMYPKCRNSKYLHHWAAALTAVVNTLIHTALVLGGIYIFFGQPYAQALGISIDSLAAVLLGVVATNTVLETILAGVVIPVLVKVLMPATERMGIAYGKRTVFAK